MKKKNNQNNKQRNFQQDKPILPIHLTSVLIAETVLNHVFYFLYQAKISRAVKFSKTTEYNMYTSDNNNLIWRR